MKLEATRCRRVLDKALRLSTQPSSHALLPQSRIEPLWQARHQISIQTTRTLTTEAVAAQRNLLPPSHIASQGVLLKTALRPSSQQEAKGQGPQRGSPKKTNRASNTKGASLRHTKSQVATARQSPKKSAKKAAKAVGTKQDEHIIEDEPFLPVPTHADYTNAPKALFLESHTSWRILTKEQIQTTEKIQPWRGEHRCIITCQVYGVDSVDSHAAVETVTGCAKTVVNARKEATRRLLGKLHARGVLKELFSEEAGKPVEIDAMTDVYNYSARNLTCPTIDIEHLPGLNRRNRLVKVSITLAEQNIRVHATRLNVEAAQNAAAILFKRAAEKYHQERGEDRLIVKDSSALTTESAKKFLDYYKMTNVAFFEAKFEEMHEYRGSNGQGAWRAQIHMDQKPIGEPIMTWGKKAGAEGLAFLTAAVALAKEDPEMFGKFQRQKKSSKGHALAPVRTVELGIEEETENIMRRAAREVLWSGTTVENETRTADAIEEAHYRPRRHLDPATKEQRSVELKQRQEKFSQDPMLADLRTKKEELPMNQYRGKVLDLIGNNTYSIVVGATGSGKTTQVPQILLEESIARGEGAETNIICTQPRRIAATSVARRVAAERNEPLQSTVGYQVRFDSKLPRDHGSITYCTTGILLAQLQNGPDQILDSTSHIIIDEVHERDIIIDYLMITLKKLMKARQRENKFVPKVVLMSATLDTKLFANYYKEEKEDGTVVPCPSLSVPGRTFPVKEKYLDDVMGELRTYDPQSLNQILSPDKTSENYIKSESAFAHEATSGDNSIADAPIDWKRPGSNNAIDTAQEDSVVPVGLVAAVIAHIAKTTSEGAILAFLPGIDEIKKTRDLLAFQPLGVDFSDPLKFKSYLLHSSIQSQEDVFAPVPPGCRKIILATNIAETSVTIPDVQYVVDTGKLKEKRYDQTTRITQLLITWVSKSNSRQRAGRAGRVQNGNYYALFSKARFGSLRAISLPEMLRSDLQEICLDIKAQAFKAPVREFLAAAIEPPSAEAVDASLLNLRALEAITENEDLTPLGKVLASLPVHPSLSKMILLGVLFRCFDPMLILGASSQGRSLFFAPLDNRNEAERARRVFCANSYSDHVALINCYRIARQLRDQQGEYALQEFARKYFMSVPAFKAIERTMREIEGILVEAGLIPFTNPSARDRSQNGDPSLNKNSSNISLMKALILAGVHPNLGVVTGSKTLQTPSERDTIISSQSLNYIRNKDERHTRGAIFAFSTMAKSSDGNSLYLKDTSVVTPLMAALFGSDLTRSGRTLVMDEWLPFYIKRPNGFHTFSAVQALSDFKTSLDTVLGAAFSRIAKRSDDEQFLADDPVLEGFTNKLVEVLNKDVSGGSAMEKVIGNGGTASSRLSVHRTNPNDYGGRRVNKGSAATSRLSTYSTRPISTLVGMRL